MKESGDYPQGAVHDSNAPYNQPEVEYVVCPDCDRQHLGCPTCEGSGKIVRTFEDDLADEETAAEEKGDRIRNESHF
jgi:hypothetical protein